MMKIKVTAIMLLTSCALFFSGCAEKTVYLKCQAEEPMRTPSVICAGEQNATAFAKCASKKYINLEKDYEVLMTRFRSCK